jgi:predicted ArsR family transcriptional regulator
MSELPVEEQLQEQRDRLQRVFTGRLVYLLRGLEERLGDPVVAAVDDTMGEAVRAEWARLAEQTGSNTIEDLIRLLWEPLRAQGFEYTQEQRADGVQMRCTRCPVADRAREMHTADWMFRLDCGADEHIVAGFNPKIGFRRTKTLMQGNDCCDHFYYYKED